MKQQDWTEQLRQRLADHEVSAPEGLWADIERRTAGRARQVVLRRWLAAAAAIALLLVGTWWALTPSSRQDSLLAEAQPQQHRGDLQENIRDLHDNIRDLQENMRDLHENIRDLQPLGTPVPSDGVATTEDTPVPSGDMAQLQPPPLTTPLEGQGTVTTENTPQDAVHHSDGIATTEGTSVPSRDVATTQAPLPSRDVTITQAPLPSRGGAGVGAVVQTQRSLQLSLHATNLMAQGSSTQVEPMLMTRSYMGPASNALSRQGPVYLADHEEKVEHHMPLTVGLSLRLPLGHRFWVGSGVNYTRVSSAFTQRMNLNTLTNRQRLHYVGVPVTAGYTFWQTPRLQAYASTGAEVMFNVKTVVDMGHVDRDRVQFSLQLSAGVEYRFTPLLSVYAQPGLRYYPGNGNHVQNIFKENALQPDLQLGLRFTVNH